MYNEGISNTGSLLDLALEKGIVEKRGSWLSYKGSQLAQGRDAAKEILKTDPKIYGEIEADVMAAMEKAWFRVVERCFAAEVWDSSASRPYPAEQRRRVSAIRKSLVGADRRKRPIFAAKPPWASKRDAASRLNLGRWRSIALQIFRVLLLLSGSPITQGEDFLDGFLDQIVRATRAGRDADRKGRSLFF